MNPNQQKLLRYKDLAVSNEAWLWHKISLFWAADQDKVGLLYSEVETQSSQRLLEIMLVDQRHKLSFVWHRRVITPLGTLLKKKFNIITDDSSGQRCSVTAFTAASKHVTEGPCNQRSTETVQRSTHTFFFFGQYLSGGLHTTLLFPARRPHAGMSGAAPRGDPCSAARLRNHALSPFWQASSSN